MLPSTPALLVGHSNALKPSGGGVQKCNQEFMAALAAAGFDMSVIPYEFERSPLTRLLDKLGNRTPRPRPQSGFLDLLYSEVEKKEPTHIFFAFNSFPDLSRRIREVFPGIRQVLLSHGTEPLDFAIEQYLRRSSGTENRPRRVADRQLGAEILFEMERRRAVDSVLALSPFEAEVEKWLGSNRVLWLPRTISETPLAPSPIDQRTGLVCTLDHPPNLAGLEALATELEKNDVKDLRLRLVGRPSSIGKMLQQRFRFIDYLGPLSDSELRAEAATWCCFINPVFVYAKGCSTKLAVGIGWELPIATTLYGIRGYTWDEAALPVARSAAELAQFVLARSRLQSFEAYRQETKRIAAITPTIAHIAKEIAAFFADIK